MTLSARARRDSRRPADTHLRSLRLRLIFFSNPSKMSVSRLRSCASSIINTEYLSPMRCVVSGNLAAGHSCFPHPGGPYLDNKGSSIVSRINTPSVRNLTRVRDGWVQLSNRTE